MATGLSVKNAISQKGSLIAALITVVIWASAFAGIRVGLEGYSPQSLALLRYLVASVMLLIYAIIVRVPMPERRDWPGIALLGFLGFSLYNVALNAGEMGVSAGAASFIIAFAPIMMAIIALISQGERLRIWGWLGILISFSGVTLISLGGSGGWRINSWALLVLIAALAQALYSVGQRGYLKKYGALRFTMYAVWTGTAFLLFFTPGLIADIVTAPFNATAAVVYMGIVPGAIGYFCWSFVLSRLPATVAGSYLYLVPGFSVLIAWLWLGEIPALISLVGGVMIVSGVIVVNTKGR